MKKKKYEAPQTKVSEVEVEGNFCASIMDEDVDEDTNISIQGQEVGAESNYFEGEQASGWDY